MNKTTFLKHFNEHLTELAKTHPKTIFDFQKEAKKYNRGYVLCQFVEDTYMTVLLKQKEDVSYSKDLGMYTLKDNNSHHFVSFDIEPFEEGLKDVYFIPIEDVQLPKIIGPTFSDLMTLTANSNLEQSEFFIFIEDEIGYIGDYAFPQEGIPDLGYEELYYERQDGDRFVALNRVTYQGQVVAFVKQAGRSGRDVQDMAIVNVEGYKSLLTKIASYRQISEHLVKHCRDIALDFTHIYGHNILDDKASQVTT